MSSTKGDDELSRARRRLDIIINLLLESGPNPSRTHTAKILRLLGFGLSDAETAAIVGKTPQYITAVKAQDKARKR